jgi:hypothetical protein
LNLTVFLEGLFTQYEGVSFNRKVQDADENASWNKFGGSISDTLSILLADANDPWGIVYAAHAVDLDTSGVCSVSVPATLSGDYYIVVKHRNSVETWSASPISFADATVGYDFTAASAQAFGNNMMDVLGDGSTWAIFTGDVGGMFGKDEYVDGFDVAPIFNKSTEGAFGFMVEDITGDGYVDGFDVALVFNNSQTAVGQNTPPNPL